MVLYARFVGVGRMGIKKWAFLSHAGEPTVVRQSVKDRVGGGQVIEQRKRQRVSRELRIHEAKEVWRLARQQLHDAKSTGAYNVGATLLTCQSDQVSKSMPPEDTWRTPLIAILATSVRLEKATATVFSHKTFVTARAMFHFSRR